MSKRVSGEKKIYEAPAMSALGSLAEQTKSGFGNTSDGSVHPPQAFTPDPGPGPGPAS